MDNIAIPDAPFTSNKQEPTTWFSDLKVGDEFYDPVRRQFFEKLNATTAEQVSGTSDQQVEYFGCTEVLPAERVQRG